MKLQYQKWVIPLGVIDQYGHIGLQAVGIVYTGYPPELDLPWVFIIPFLGSFVFSELVYL